MEAKSGRYVWCRNCGEGTRHVLKDGQDARGRDPVWVCSVCRCEVSKSILARYGVVVASL